MSHPIRAAAGAAGVGLALSGWVAPAGLPAQTAPAAHGWRVATPEAVGLDPAPLRALARAIEAGEFGLVDRVVVVRDGRLVMDESYAHDYREISRGHAAPLGCGTGSCPEGASYGEFNYLDPETHPVPRGRRVHTLQSITKSIASTLIGIAIGRGEISGVDAPLLSFFDAYDLTGVDPRLHRATLEDLLTMRTGIEWHETDRPADETNTTLQLERSADWVRFTLAQPMDAVPGEKWTYNSGGSHLMSAVLHRATGRTADAYAEEHLFGPLGISDYYWKRAPEGLPDTEGGLYLEARDLAKIGWLVLEDGVWEGRRVLPPGWAAEATARRVERVNAAGWGYGYQWWRLDRGGTEVWAGLGFGGQLLLILPRQRLVGVANAWNLFGGGHASLLQPFLGALLAAGDGAGEGG